MSNTKAKIQAKKVVFSALNPYLEETTPLPIQKEVAGKKYLPYGRFNEYPRFLLGLYEDCSTLKAIIDGNVNYVLGDDITVLTNKMSKEEIAEILIEVTRDWYIFGYAFVQVLRNPFGEVQRIVHLPAEWVRTDKDRQSFWYSEKWDSRGSWKSVVYPAFMEDSKEASSVLMIGNGRGTYPSPLWSAAIKDVEMECKIETFHYNELENNFLGSFLLNMNNGTPDPEVQSQIERDLIEKFSGAENAGRFLISYNESVTNRTTVERLQADNFDTRYNALASRVREMIFCAFKAQPILFGLTSETRVGFSTTEFGDLFRLYNKTMISPVQDMLKRALKRIFGADILEITPFTI